ncbi:hypothetical protein P152DRAFT_392377 [Eremomyces bilateralis CBS 781.70]|uniref:Nuclear pore complex subunit Nup192 n=1 Tax=Eremomyces bilateralis CBS 781.70 TaxID=1392243 RepID=A0A6G1GAV2_9PEZI|nr:uncharacterized protein P152DRAFT_392377 [Eremomyces bilateralis CBS 781.70]KAF1815066.1 hypothetical protein P152DRAFT_392377 [Eremomyces bilateralis CBS 781.70]
MDDVDDLAALEELHRDLLGLQARSLGVLQRLDPLLDELRSWIPTFRELLNKPQRNESSRRTLMTGTITVDEVEYSITDEFKVQVIEVSDELDLDELRASKLYLQAQDDAVELDRSPTTTAVIRFHKRRQLLLECLRLLLVRPWSASEEDEGNDEYFASLGEGTLESLEREWSTILDLLLGRDEGDNSVDRGSQFWNRCQNYMENVEKWIATLLTRFKRYELVDLVLPAELQEVFTFQLSSLSNQHASLSAICVHLTNRAFTTFVDFRNLLNRLSKLDKHDAILLHYFPIYMAFVAQFGKRNTALSPEEDRQLTQLLHPAKDTDPWILRNFHAACLVCWLSEYGASDAARERVNANDRAKQIELLFTEALRNGAFHFLLSLAKDVHRDEWYDPAKVGLVSFLLQETPSLPQGTSAMSEHIEQLIVKSLQAFIGSLITNMPDALRKLKEEEDENRRLLQSRFQRGTKEYDLHLERFMVIIAYAYEGKPQNALDFWTETDGNLRGFLSWAAKRQTTPRAAAFCEMLCSLSEDEACANYAHGFLRDESDSTTGKLRRATSLSWTQIFNELQFYSNTMKDRPAIAPNPSSAHSFNDQIIEPESQLMLECYLRLVYHLCRTSPDAREWVISHPVINLPGILFQLCSSGIENRLRACAFNAITALLTNKSVELGRALWNALDHWIFGSLSSSPKSGASLEVAAQTEMLTFNAIASGFEEANAFVGLVNALVAPFPSEFNIFDSLPFPEQLGAAYRMPGIESYIDFTIGRLFAETSVDMSDRLQQQVLRLNCLTLIATCLSTFNDNLVAIAMLSNIKVDSAIQTTSLSAYVRLHPFARVMDWMFNDKVLSALFDTANQKIDEVNSVTSTSPQIAALLKSIEVMDLIMKLQSTYVDYVRPIIKTQTTERRAPVANSALASFEDAVLNNLRLVVDLGLYCGTGHEELTMVCLRLLEKLSSSRKLALSTTSSYGSRAEKSKIIIIMEGENDSERISRGLIPAMQLDVRELEAGPETAGYLIKVQILDFLYRGLSTLSDRAGLSHLLLGFSSGPSAGSITISDDGLFTNGMSLFHSLVRLAVEHPICDGDLMIGWQLRIRQACIDILRTLWKSPLSSQLVMLELRNHDFAFHTALRNVLVHSRTLWDGRTLDDDDFLLSSSAYCLRYFLQLRAAMYDYIARELRAATLAKQTTLVARLKGMILGTTTVPGGDPLPNPTIFDLFDFAEFEFPESIPFPETRLLQGLDLAICETEGADGTPHLDLTRVEELLLLKRNELERDVKISTAEESAVVKQECLQVLAYVHARNQLEAINAARIKTLRSWIQLLTVVFETCSLEANIKDPILMHALQVILPKLERAIQQNAEEASYLTAAAGTILQHSNHAAFARANRNGDVANDMLFQLFRILLNGIATPSSAPEFRHAAEQVTHTYLRNVTATSTKASPLSKQILRILKLCGDRLFQVLCDDAQSGGNIGRLPPILLLETMVSLTAREESKLVIEQMSKLNFTGLLVDSIKYIPAEVAASPPADIPQLVTCYHAILALLLRICQTRTGAIQILNAGLFQAVRESQLFSADPDIGLEIDNPQALQRFYEVMLAVLRVINAVVLTRGPQNERVLQQARAFVRENRSSIVGVFKRQAGIGSAAGNAQDELNELVDHFALLIAATEFIEVCERVLPCPLPVLTKPQHEDKTAFTKAQSTLFS